MESTDAGFEAEYFPDLARREGGHFWFEGRNALIEWAVKRYAPSAGRYLEVGCGTGFALSAVAQALPAAQIHASEIFSAGLSIAQTRVPGASFLQMDARKIPFREEFDLLGAFDVIEHIPEDQRVLDNFHAALVPEGVLLLTVPQHPALWSASDTYARHQRRYTRNDLESKLVAAGFEIVDATSFVSALLPAMWLSRRRQRDVEAFRPEDEFAIGRTVNALLRGVLWSELALIKMGLRFPVGGSLLMVARRPALRS